MWKAEEEPGELDAARSGSRRIHGPLNLQLMEEHGETAESEYGAALTPGFAAVYLEAHCGEEEATLEIAGRLIWPPNQTAIPTGLWGERRKRRGEDETSAMPQR